MNFSYKKLILILVLFIFPLLMLYANTRKPEERTFISRSIIYIQYPLEFVVSRVVHTVGSIWSEYIDVIHVKKELKKLSKENNALKYKLNDLSEAALENARLRKLLNMTGRFEEHEIISAHIYSASTSPAAAAFRIDRGSKDGIELYNAVMSGEGLVGRISSVATHFSEVIPVLDNRSYIPCRLKKTRVNCTVLGRGLKEQPEVIHIITTEKVHVGDEVVTDAILPVFPPGLLVGRISKVEKQPNTLFVKARLELASKIDSVEEVAVIITRRK